MKQNSQLIKTLQCTMYRKPFIDTTEKKESGFILLFNHSRPECGLKKRERDGTQILPGDDDSIPNQNVFQMDSFWSKTLGIFYHPTSS